jgi:YbbR domain-containing protein
MSDNIASIKLFLKKSATENLELKLIAVIIAALLFFFVNLQEESERLIDVEVEKTYPAPSSSLVLTSEFPDVIRLRVRGPRSKVKSIKQGLIGPIKVDLSERTGGTSYYTFNPEDFELHRHGLKFVRVTPESVLVKMERQITKQLPVRVRTYGKLANGAELIGEPKVVPSIVTAFGTASSLRNVSAIETEDIDIEGLAVGEHVFLVPLRVVDGVAPRGSDETKVTLTVRWIPDQRMLSGLLVQARGTDLTAEFRPKEVAVALTGPKISLDKLDPATVRPIVLFEEDQANQPGISRNKVTVLEIPNGIKVTSIVPKKVQVKLSPPVPVKNKKNAIQ